MSIESDVYLAKQENFKCLLVRRNDISNLRPDDPDYRNMICGLDIYESVECNSENFFDIMADKMELRSLNRNFSLNTQEIWVDENYIYEMIHMDLDLKDLPVEIYNGVANVLKRDYQHIFGNILLLKTYIPPNDDINKIVDFTKSDLNVLLENRVKHIGVKIDDDGEMEEFTWYYEPDKIINDFFSAEEKKIECMFLNHNLVIYYTKGEKSGLEKLIDDKYNEVIIMTKVSEEHYGNVRLWEIKLILELLKTECPLETPEEWIKPNDELKEKLDMERRTFRFNKFKALEIGRVKYLSSE